METCYTLHGEVNSGQLQHILNQLDSELSAVSARSTSAVTFERDVPSGAEPLLSRLQSISDFIAGDDVTCRAHTTGPESVGLTLEGPSDLLTRPSRAALSTLAFAATERQ